MESLFYDIAASSDDLSVKEVVECVLNDVVCKIWFLALVMVRECASSNIISGRIVTLWNYYC